MCQRCCTYGLTHSKPVRWVFKFMLWFLVVGDLNALSSVRSCSFREMRWSTEVTSEWSQNCIVSLDVIGSYHKEGGVICVSGPSGGVQTLRWDMTHDTSGNTLHTHAHTAGYGGVVWCMSGTGDKSEEETHLTVCWTELRRARRRLILLIQTQK